MIQNDIGKHLELIRLSKDYSLRTAGKLCKLSHGYIRDVELGDNRKTGPAIIPQPQTLRKFAEAYQTDFNELMRIAGHIEDVKSSSTVFNTINIDLNNVLFVQVDESNRVQFHQSDRIYYENMTLHEFMQLEELLESNRFIRVHSGTYVNLNHISEYNENSGHLQVGRGETGKVVEITWVRGQMLKNEILRSVAANKRLNMDSKVEFVQQPAMLKVRNLQF
ncbi:LytTR family transcriptional regulator DNA-binding domain-containing protein [Cohnella soli]|uniref:LytTR family transcriptional regulator DNA-binding domain-containing protein n=1 Tax=Cohnella soli TaxID=425005 RepID=A0ABW0HQR5_9BACL